MSVPLPHEGRARLLTRVVETTADAIVAEGRVAADTPYAIDGRVPSYVALELAAQAAAAMEALEARRHDPGHEPGQGFLVRVPSLRMPATSFAAERTLTVSARRTGRAGPLHRYEATVACDGAALLEASFSVWIPVRRAGATAG